jgi:hypothetical protein
MRASNFMAGNNERRKTILERLSGGYTMPDYETLKEK